MLVGFFFPPNASLRSRTFGLLTHSFDSCDSTRSLAIGVGPVRSGPVRAGTMTTGGTESILMAVKAYRERGRALHGVTRPNMVLSISAHPAFEKVRIRMRSRSCQPSLGSRTQPNAAV